MNSLGSRFTLLALGLAAVALPARAQLFNAADQAEITSVIDRGPLTFTSVFTKVAGDGQNATNFNLAADGKGPSLAVLDVTPFDTSDGLFDLPDQVIGGGTPLAFDSSNSWHLAFGLDQSAFLFNFTDGAIQRENTTGAAGAFQTYNSFVLGPVFGLGDLVTGFDLEHGTALHASYGGTSALTPNILGTQSIEGFRINRLEVYSVALAAIPEPATYGLIVAASLAFVVLLRRKQRTVTALTA
ncbi:MAG TPA: PEP_CTERM-anchored TLD domain-containing protein [Opitutaceae bacterium]|jgi:hypothetical protein|nr:PEP_CTERM-anchored TLD domain-containing protein [Opitutaceae bacterium]